MNAPHRLPWIAAGLAFVAYAWLCAPGPAWLDSQQLGAAGAQLGVPHPTGFPLFCLVARVMGWLPLGELAFRIHLGSALAAAIAVGFSAHLLVLLAGADRVTAIAGATTALLLGGSLVFFRQATVTEVYAATAAAIAVSLTGLVRMAGGAGPGVGLAHAFLAGVFALGLHGSYRILLLIPFVAVLAWRLRGRARWPLAAPTLAVLGAVAITLYLPVRSASGDAPALDWGHPRTAAALVEHVTAARIRRAFAAEIGVTDKRVVAGHFRRIAERAEEDLGVLALVAAAAGAVALGRRRDGRAGLLLVGAVAVGDVAYAIWLNPMGVADRQTGVPLVLALSVLAGAGVVWAARAFGRFAPIVAGALGLMVAVQPLLEGGEMKIATRSSDAPRAWGEAVLAATPPGGVALVRNDSTAGLLFWLTTAEPIRPDVAALARQHLWDAKRTRAVLGRTGATGGGGVTVAELIAGDRPVAWEIADDPDPAGPSYRPSIPMSLVGAAARGYRLEAVDLERLFPPPSLADPETRHVAARAFENQGALASRAGDVAGAARLVERALEIEERPHARISAARYRLALNEDAAAVAHLRRAPESASAAALSGVLLARAGKCAAARAAFERALQLNPSETDASENLKKLGGCRER